MATLSESELARLWIRAGGDPRYADAMAYIAGQPGIEGSGQTDVVNKIGATGPWQIYPGGERYKDPLTNARAAVAKFNGAKRAGGTGFEPWLASKGKWGDQINERTGEVVGGGKKSGGGGLLDSIGGGFGGLIPDVNLNPLDGIAESLAAIGEFALKAAELLLTPDGWRRLGKMVIGSVLLLMGISRLSKSMGGPNVGRGARRAASVVPITRAESAVAKVA